MEVTIDLLSFPLGQYSINFKHGSEKSRNYTKLYHFTFFGFEGQPDFEYKLRITILKNKELNWTLFLLEI